MITTGKLWGAFVCFVREYLFKKKKKERMWANTYSKKINNINHLQNTTMEKAIHDILK